MGNEADVVFVDATGPLPVRLASLLTSLDASVEALNLALDELSLRLGVRLPDQAQTLTYWQRGDVGRALRGAGFLVRVEYGRVVLVRHVEGRGKRSTFAEPVGVPGGEGQDPGDHGRS